MTKALTKTSGLAKWSPQQMLLMRRTVAKDCNDAEFDQFMHIASHLDLDPLRRQIYAFIFNKNNAEKRQMAIVTAIDGFRTIAARSKNYRPDDRPTRFVFDESAKDADKNPLGLVSADVSVYRFAHGEWFPITVTAYWDEFAPLVPDGEWRDTDSGKRKFFSTGTFKLDPSKDAWRHMPRVMLAKCAEAQAIRRGWPDELSDVYEHGELDQAEIIDLSPSEYAEAANVQNRLERIGGKDSIMFDMGNGLEPFPIGKAADRIIEHTNKLPIHEAIQWRNANLYPLKEFWARNASDALDVKKHFEALQKKLDGQETAA